MFEEKGEKERSYVLGYGIEALEKEGKEYYYHKDERNSTTYLSNERREIENRYAYDGYGRSQRKDEGVENAIRYTGQRYEEELEGCCLGVREYREEYGRFLTENVYEGDGTNLYAYCRNNPIQYYDPSGYSGETNQTEKGHTRPKGEEERTPSAGTEGESNSKLKWGNPKSIPTYGHTFTEHGKKKTLQQLIDRAKYKGHQIGQWLDDKKAADFIANIAKNGEGIYKVDLPTNVTGHTYLPDGTRLNTDKAIVVVEANGNVKTAYPFSSLYLIN